MALLVSASHVSSHIIAVELSVPVRLHHGGSVLKPCSPVFNLLRENVKNFYMIIGF